MIMSVIESVRKKNARTVSDTQARVLAEIRNNSNITIPQMAKNLSLSKSTIDKAMFVLKKAGVIERIGSNKSGYWKIND